MNALDYSNKGVKLVQQGDYDAAIALFDTALAEFPDDYFILGQRAVAYRRKGEHEKALADYTRMTVLKPEDSDGWNSRGNLYHELGDYDKAIADFTQCIPLSRAGEGTFWSNRGISYYEKGDLNAAFADFNKAVACWKEPEYTDWAILWRGRVWKKRGNLTKALKDFTLAAVRNPENDEAAYEAGYIWFMRKDYDKAIKYFSDAIAARDDETDYWLARGVCYWNICVKDKIGFWSPDGETVSLAEEDFTKAIECAPDRAEGYFNRGSVRCGKARDSHGLIKEIARQKATAEAERAVMLAQLEHIGGKDLVPDADAVLRGFRSNRDQAEMIMAQSSGLMALDDATEAIEDLSRAIALDPDNAEAFYQRGLAYALLGEADKALADYEQTRALDPDHRRVIEKLQEIADKQ
jgi:tetratricopeptide (TPR) repeat protein